MRPSIFQYEPLREDRTIRLLEFLPGDSPQVQIITTKLDEAPNYAALSYTWGENIFDHSLSINGQSLPITQNLSEAIGALFKTVRRDNLKFWVDAVCINQNDLPERGSQVSFMDQIYKSAQRVTVWLGKESSDSNLAMDKIQEWSDAIRDKRALAVKGTDGSSGDVFREMATSSSVYGPPGTEARKAWSAIFSLWERPWWRRSWIVQETAPLPGYWINIHCGNRTVNLECLRLVLDLRYYVVLYNAADDFFMTTFEQGFAELLDNMNSNLTHNPRTLIWVLERLRTFESKDPRDKVYAALSMARDFPRGRMKPDYTLDVADVYVDVARHLSSDGDDHSLDFFGYVIRPVEGFSRLDLLDDSIPTWAPDWRGPKMDIITLRKHIRIHNEEVSARAYSASLETKPRMKILDRTLHIDGVFVDTITSVLPLCTDPRISANSVERAWSENASASVYVAGGTMRDALLHTIMADVDAEDPSQQYSPLRRGAFMDWTLADAPTSELSNADMKRREMMLNNLKCASLGRRVYFTAGGYVGLGPGAAKPGDKVCLFFGGQVLYVLRIKDTNTHQFVGETYLHGLMDGEALARTTEADVCEFRLL